MLIIAMAVVVAVAILYAIWCDYRGEQILGSAEREWAIREAVDTEYGHVWFISQHYRDDDGYMITVRTCDRCGKKSSERSKCLGT